MYEEELLRKCDIKKQYGISYYCLADWQKKGIIIGINGVLFSRHEIESAINRPRAKGGEYPRRKPKGREEQ